ncbi:MAG: rod shape-determining protein RodA [Thiohalospira sp.]|uniref:rod shape-determining protein RodA n=1 Tax=Thiohalospira sp. TaxID=3080549 RepID=UPI003980924B
MSIADLPGTGLLHKQRLSDRLHIDIPLLSALLIIMAGGLVVIYSASDQDMGLIWRHGIRATAGLVGALLLAQLPPEQLRRLLPWVYGLGMLLLVLVLYLGDTSKGAQRWLDFGFMRFQPSEMMKLAVPGMVAAYLANTGLPPGFRHTMLTLALVALPAGLVIQQPDLGTGLLIVSSGFIVLFLGGISWRWLATGAALAAAATPVAWNLIHDYQRSRVLTFLNPEREPLGTGYHIIQSKIAIGSGGLYGKGWLNGSQSHLEFLPERSTDFIFAVLAEEFGFAGGIAVLAAYTFVIGRGLMIALQAQDVFGRLLAGGISLGFFVYAFINIGMVAGMLPVVGLPLPLVSYGGSSLITLMAGFGLLMSIQTHRRFIH